MEKHIFPVDTLIEGDIDFGFMAKFKITGGNIKNIALSAAFLAVRLPLFWKFHRYQLLSHPQVLDNSSADSKQQHYQSTP